MTQTQTKRFEVRVIGTQGLSEQTQLGKLLLATDDAQEAKRTAEDQATVYYYGTAVIDREAETVDMGWDECGKPWVISLNAADVAPSVCVTSTDEELMAVYEQHRRNANGEAIGNEKDSPAEAVEREGWTLLRVIYGGTNHPGCPVLATDPAERLWVVNDIEGPWAIQVGGR